MKRIWILLTLIVVQHHLLRAQENVREQVYVHLNAHTLVSGETLYFSAYCNSVSTGKSAAMSQILYVELIGEKGVVEQQKVQLSDGRGHGEIFVSSKIASGRYYLVAYTRWMKNFKEYFQTSVSVINPFEKYPNPELPQTPALAFFCNANVLVPGEKNHVSFHLQAKDPHTYKGKIMTSAGQTIAELRISALGIGSVMFTPEAGAVYQAILTDAEGQVTFHPLPVVSTEKATLVTSYHAGEWRVTLAGMDDSSVKLVVSGMDAQKHEVPFTSGEARIRASEFAGELLLAEVYAGSQILASQWLVRPDLQPRKSESDLSYHLRETVSLPLKLQAGTYSVSVRKFMDARLDVHHHAVWNTLASRVKDAPVDPVSGLSLGMSADVLAAMAEWRQVAPTPEFVRWLPELREEILTGTLRDSLGNPLPNQLVSLSFTGAPYQLRVSRTNAAGDFVIPFQSPMQDHQGVVTALHPYQPVQVSLEEPFMGSLPNAAFTPVWLDSALVAKVLARSVNIQLANAYALPPVLPQPSNGWQVQFPYDDRYFLDDYARFSTLKETFTEYIVTANLRERRSEVIQTTFDPGLGRKALPPLVLLDGVPVRGQDVAPFDPDRLESIQIVLNRYFLGPLAVDGVVDMATKSHDLSGFQLQNYHHSFPVKGLSVSAGQPDPEWVGQPQTHVPDQREQLLWLPNWQVEAEAVLRFTTSDVPGAYEIVIEGFDTAGKPVSQVMIFDVEPTTIKQ